jgi:hypothetical protein
MTHKKDGSKKLFKKLNPRVPLLALGEFPECQIRSTRGRADPALGEETPFPSVMPRLSGKVQQAHFSHRPIYSTLAPITPAAPNPPHPAPIPSSDAAAHTPIPEPQIQARARSTPPPPPPACPAPAAAAPPLPVCPATATAAPPPQRFFTPSYRLRRGPPAPLARPVPPRFAGALRGTSPAPMTRPEVPSCLASPAHTEESAPRRGHRGECAPPACPDLPSCLASPVDIGE